MMATQGGAMLLVSKSFAEGGGCVGGWVQGVSCDLRLYMLWLAPLLFLCLLAASDDEEQGG